MSGFKISSFESWNRCPGSGSWKHFVNLSGAEGEVGSVVTRTTGSPEPPPQWPYFVLQKLSWRHSQYFWSDVMFKGPINSDQCDPCDVAPSWQWQQLYFDVTSCEASWKFHRLETSWFILVRCCHQMEWYRIFLLQWDTFKSYWKNKLPDPPT
jgi:hypothetical protein